MYNHPTGPCSDVAILAVVVVCLMFTCIATLYYNRTTLPLAGWVSDGWVQRDCYYVPCSHRWRRWRWNCKWRIGAQVLAGLTRTTMQPPRVLVVSGGGNGNASLIQIAWFHNIKSHQPMYIAKGKCWVLVASRLKHRIAWTASGFALVFSEPNRASLGFTPAMVGCYPRIKLDRQEQINAFA